MRSWHLLEHFTWEAGEGRPEARGQRPEHQLEEDTRQDKQDLSLECSLNRSRAAQGDHVEAIRYARENK